MDELSKYVGKVMKIKGLNQMKQYLNLPEKGTYKPSEHGTTAKVLVEDPFPYTRHKLIGRIEGEETIVEFLAPGKFQIKEDTLKVQGSENNPILLIRAYERVNSIRYDKLNQKLEEHGL